MIYSCRNCVPPKRHPGCHAVCEAYLKEKETCDKARDQRRHDQRIKDDCYISARKAKKYAENQQRKGRRPYSG